MLTSKQRSFLKKLASKERAIMQVGKNAVSPEVVKSINECLEKRELIKISVLDNCESAPKEVAEILGERTRSDVVTVIGRKIILYRPLEEPVINLPK